MITPSTAGKHPEEVAEQEVVAADATKDEKKGTNPVHDIGHASSTLADLVIRETPFDLFRSDCRAC